MARVNSKFEIDYQNSNGEDDYVCVEIETDVTTVESGFDYEYGSIRGFHSIPETEVSETPYKDCIVSEHTDEEMQIILKWIGENEDAITDRLCDDYDPKDDEPDYDGYPDDDYTDPNFLPEVNW